MLDHPFFDSEDPQLPTLACPRISKVDVVFSYQSTQEALLRRLRRALNQLGFNSFDGTQVSGGRDWRVMYFRKLEAALCFVPIVSPNLLQSQACYEEARVANGLDIPILQILQDPVACTALFDSQRVEQCVPQFRRAKTVGHLISPKSAGIEHIGHRLEVFSEWGYGQATNNCAATVPATGAAFEDNFFANFALLANALESSLTYDSSLHAVIAYAKPDEQFAAALAMRLEKHLNVVAITKSGDWAERSSAKSVLIPVLSGNFLKAHFLLAEVMQIADAKQMAFCPVLHDQRGYLKTLNKIGKSTFNMPYMLSILNTSNRVPANLNFGANWTDHSELLLTAVDMLRKVDRSDTAASVARRLPKYKSLLADPAAKFPARGSFTDSYETNLQQLRSFLDTCDGNGEHIILVHATKDNEVAQRLQRDLVAVGVKVVVECSPISWYTPAVDCTTCIPILTTDFVACVQCERQVTWAKDHGLRLALLMWDGYVGLETTESPCNTTCYMGRSRSVGQISGDTDIVTPMYDTDEERQYS